MSRRQWGGLVLAGCLWAAPAAAYQFGEGRWPTAEATFHVSIPGADGLWDQAFEDAMASWVTAGFQYRIVRGSYSDPCSDFDARNGVAFTSTVCGSNYGSGTLAVTLYLYDTFSGEMQEADIVFNSNLDWNVYYGPVQFAVEDFRRVAVHELGHALGLDHETQQPAIMAPQVGSIVDPQNDDINGVIALYGLQSVADDYGNGIGTAHAIAPDSRTDGRIEVTGDEDYFTLLLPSAGRLTLHTEGGTDTLGDLLDANGQVLAANDDCPAGGLNFCLDQTLPAGRHYLRLRSYNGATGSYTLVARFSPGDSTPGDQNADGRADVLLRHVDGRWLYYPMNAGNYLGGQAGQANLTRSLDWAVRGRGDLDGDGRADVLLRRGDGRWLYYPMNGRRYIGGGAGQANLTINRQWAYQGMGDLNGDGRDDVLLRHQDGRWLYYPMNGKRYIGGGAAGQANLTRDTSWSYAGIGDLDGDGRDDVLLRHADGRWLYYRMNGKRYIGADTGQVPLPQDRDWSVQALADFNADGHDELLLRHRDGRWRQYAFDGRQLLGAASGGVALPGDTALEFASAGDLNGDGRADVLLRDRGNGGWRYFPMDGRQVMAGVADANLTRALGWRPLPE